MERCTVGYLIFAKRKTRKGGTTEWRTLCHATKPTMAEALALSVQFSEEHTNCLVEIVPISTFPTEHYGTSTTEKR